MESVTNGHWPVKEKSKRLRARLEDERHLPARDMTYAPCACGGGDHGWVKDKGEWGRVRQVVL